MAFLNEFVSDEDISKYKLNEIWIKFHPEDLNDNMPSSFRYYWTIDRDRDIYFMTVNIGREEHSNRHTCVLYWKGQHLTIYIDINDESSRKFNEQPFRIIWELVSISSLESIGLTYQDVIKLLKEALTTHGCDGIYRQIPNTIVEFKF